MPAPDNGAERFELLREQVRLFDIQMVYKAPSGELIYEQVADAPVLEIPRYLYIEQSVDEGLGWGYASDDLQTAQEYMEEGKQAFRRWEAEVAGLREELIDEMEVYEECEPAIIYDLQDRKVVWENG